MAESPLKLARILWVAAAVTAVLAALLYVDVFGIDAEGEREAALRVEIDQQHPLALLGERGTQRGHRGRLAHAALLVHHCDRRCHEAKVPLGVSRPSGMLTTWHDAL